MNSQDLIRARECLSRTDRLLIITGAGISADSGLPTYRGTGGLYNEATENGLPIESVLSGSMLQQYPALCWRYLAEIGRSCLSADPNDGHFAIADWLQRHENSWLLTQNIDGFHRLAGSPIERLIEIHGRLSPIFCSDCGYQTQDLNTILHNALPPLCPECHGVLRPPVVLFGELLPEEALSNLYREIEKGFDGVLLVGTTASFPYIIEPVMDTKRRGGFIIEINLDRSELSHIVDFRLFGKALDILTPLLGHI